MFLVMYMAAFVAAFSLTLAASFVLSNKARVKERLLVVSQMGGDSQTDERMELPFFERVIKPVYQRAALALGSMTPVSIKQNMEKNLQYAGRPWNLTANGLLVLQLATGFVLFFLVFGLMALVGGPGRGIFLAVVVGILGFLVPMLVINMKASARKALLQKTLPDFLDMLYVSVEAGLGFDMALKRVADQMPGEMAKEFIRVLDEINAGRRREEALRNIIKRTGVQDLSIFVSSVIQTEQLGSNIGNTLRIQADSMRIKRKQRAEENAMKAPVKMLFPIVLFIFPALFVVILGPAVIRMLEVFVDLF